jgi:hypothetical protein
MTCVWKVGELVLPRPSCSELRHSKKAVNLFLMLLSELWHFKKR